MITALIRTHNGREELVKRAIRSAEENGCRTLVHYGDVTPGFQYNLYCNDLKEQLTEGWGFYLDSDDYVIPGAIDRIIPYLSYNKVVICQMLRNGKPKPANVTQIKRGFIGGPCIFFHHSLKHLSNWTDDEAGDWHFIEGMIRKVPYNFVKIPVVDAGKRNYGR